MRELLKIKQNEDGSIDIPIDTEYALLIGRKDDFSEFQIAVEKFTIINKPTKTIDDLAFERFEVFMRTKEQLIDDINNGLQFLVWNKKGINGYSLLTIEQLTRKR